MMLAIHARIAFVALIVISAAAALANRVTCPTAPCVLAGTIVLALTPQR